MFTEHPFKSNVLLGAKNTLMDKTIFCLHKTTTTLIKIIISIKLKKNKACTLARVRRENFLRG